MTLYKHEEWMYAIYYTNQTYSIKHTNKYKYIYIYTQSSAQVSTGNTLQDLPRLGETTDNT
jgi:hypothetical protein